MPIIEIDLSDELGARLEKVANRRAVSATEMAKYILAHQLAGEKTIDWVGLIQKGREALACFMQETKK